MFIFLIKFLLPFIVLVLIKKSLDKKYKDQETGKGFLYIISQLLTVPILILGAIIIISLTVYFIPNLGIQSDDISYVGNFVLSNILDVLFWVVTTPLVVLELIVLSLLIIKRNKIKDVQSKKRNYIAFIITFFITMIAAIGISELLNSPDRSQDDIMYTLFLIYPAVFFAFLNSLLLSEIVGKLSKTASNVLH